MSGHSKWSTIKHKKGAADAKRGKIFTKLIKEITVAARLGGGDPGGNPRLRKAIDDAKAQNMPNDNVTRAIKKGTGELEGMSYEELTYEGTGPNGTFFLVDVLTDNRNRTAAEIRKIFDKHNGVLGAAGSAAWAFESKGVVTLDESAATEEQLFEIAVGAGAEDVSLSDGQWYVITAPSDIDVVRDALEKANITVKNGQFEKHAKNPKSVSGRDAQVCVNLTETLEDNDDVQKVWTDFDLSEEELAQLSQ